MTSAWLQKVDRLSNALLDSMSTLTWLLDRNQEGQHSSPCLSLKAAMSTTTLCTCFSGSENSVYLPTKRKLPVDNVEKKFRALTLQKVLKNIPCSDFSSLAVAITSSLVGVHIPDLSPLKNRH